MKAISIVASTLVLCVVSTTTALSQSARKDNRHEPDAKQVSAEVTFARLATLAGNWTGHAGMESQPGTTSPVQASFRVTSGGSALLQEMLPQGKAYDPSNGDDDPITMLYVDGDRLILLMYCDFGKNRARMAGKLSPDGKTVAFTFLDVAGGRKYGYMDHALFTLIDADHHTEDWIYMRADGKPAKGHIDFVRAKPIVGASRSGDTREAAPVRMDQQVVH